MAQSWNHWGVLRARGARADLAAPGVPNPPRLLSALSTPPRHALALQLLQCAQASMALRAIVASEECTGAWRKCCHDEFGLIEPCSPPCLGLMPCASFRAAWLSWRREFDDFYATPEDIALLHRAARTWGDLRCANDSSSF